jgi:hypothetical protein
MYLIIFRFVFLGTFVGGGVFLLSQSMPSEMDSWLTLIPMAIFGSFLASFLALPLGGVPAAVVGFAYWFVLSRFTKQNPSFICRVLIGACIGAIVSVTFGGLLFSQASMMHSAAQNLISWASAGAFGSAISALSVGQRTYEFAFRSREIANLTHHSSGTPNGAP